MYLPRNSERALFIIPVRRHESRVAHEQGTFRVKCYGRTARTRNEFRGRASCTEMNTPAAADDAPRNESVSSTRTSQRQVVDPPNLDGDWIHFHLLTILYILQGFPSALSECLPIFLQDTVTLTYTDQVSSWCGI